MNAILVFVLRLVLVLFSYIFLAWIVYTIFTDLRSGISHKENKIVPLIILEAQIENENLTKRFRQKEIILGRDPSADFPLKNETISLRHCKISYHNKQWWVEDLESTNGTSLNNDPIKKETILTNDDKLLLGKVEILIRINHDTVSE